MQNYSLPLPLILKVFRERIGDLLQSTRAQVVDVIENPDPKQSRDYPLMFVTTQGNVPLSVAIEDGRIFLRSPQGNLEFDLSLRHFVGEPN